MLYIIGLGLNVDGISAYGLEVVQRCKKVYLENYTVDFPYKFGELVDVFHGKKIIEADREFVEGLGIVDEARKMDVALLVYGSPLTATTHIALIQEAKRLGVKYKIIYNASILDAVAETGLQLYKFGKIASMPTWDSKKKFTPDSFMEVVKQNQSIDAHSLILIDIGLELEDALKQLEKAVNKHKINLDKIVVCSRLGAGRSKIIYAETWALQDIKNLEKPYCIIIPGKLHFLEKEVLEEFI